MIVIDKWAGLVTNASPYAIPSGAAVTQVNIQCISPGQLTVRDGMSAVTWASSTGSSAAVRVAFRAPCNGAERIIYQNSNGQVYAVTGPS